MATTTRSEAKLVGTNAERLNLSLVDLETGTEFDETDTGNTYKVYGSSWYRVNTSGARSLSMSSTSVWAYGPPASSLYLEGAATGAAAGVLYTSGTITNYNRFTVEVSGLTATSADVFASIDGTNFSAVRLIDANTGAVFGTTPITANGMYYVEGKYKSIRVDQVGAGAVTIRYNHGAV